MKWLFTCFLLCLSSAVFAQKPDWTDYYQRESQYPENMFLTGFASQGNVAQNNPELFDVLTEVARKQLIESIQVKIKSIAELNIQNVNTNTNEEFKLTSVSLAEANIVGLQFETYYDRKNKEAYAFAYARRNEVITYYENLIKSNLDKIEQYQNEAAQAIDVGNNREALKALFSCNNLFRELEESRLILTALGITSTSSLKTAEANQKKLEVKSSVESLLSSKQLTMQDVGYYLAYGLSLQTGKIEGGVQLQAVTYRDTELVSDLSVAFTPVLENNLVNVASYKVAENTGELELKGTYWEENDGLKIIYNLNESGKTTASMEANLPYEWVEANNLEYIPKNIKKANLLDMLELKAVNPNISAKVNQDLDEPLNIRVDFLGNSDENVIANLPIKFSFLGENSKVIGTFKSDRFGVVKAFIGKITSDKKRQIIKAEIDIAAFVGVDESSAYYQKILREHKVPSARFFLNVSGLSMFITSTETNLGKQMTIPFIEPSLKEALSNNGFAFTSEMGQADYAIDIQANARAGNSYEGLYFSFADATVSVMDLKSGMEVYKGSFKDVKGGSINYERAGIAALKKIANQVSDEMLSELKKS